MAVDVIRRHKPRPDIRPMVEADIAVDEGQGIFVSQGRRSVTWGSQVPPFLASDIIFCP